MPDGEHLPGLGPHKCRHVSSSGRCGNQEIEGLEFCLLHMPDELLGEAEEITGARRCRDKHGQPGACRSYAASGTVPPVCTAHGGNQGSMSRTEGARRVHEGKLAETLAVILAENGEKLLEPPGITDPLTELLDLAAEIKAGKEILRKVVSHLYSKDRIRYAHSKVGEQLRMEVLLYERALERFAHILVQISRLKIDERLAGVREQTADMLERALDQALESSGVGIEGKQQARETFRRHLKVVA